MTLVTVLLACERRLEEGDFPLSLAPSTYVPSVARAGWSGPEGAAELWAVPKSDYDPGDPLPGGADFEGGDWHLVSSATLEDAVVELPVALLYPGEWRLRVVVDDGGARTVSDVTEHEVEEPPSAVTPATVTLDAGSTLGRGFVVAHQYAPAGRPEETLPVIFDREGRVVWWMPADPTLGRVLRAVPTADQRSLLIQRDLRGPDDVVDLVGLGGETLVRTVTPDATHDAVQNADGSISYLSYTYGAAGSMPEYPGWEVASDAVRTVPAGATEPSAVSTSWDFLEDYVAEPAAQCAHTVPNSFVPGKVEWTHANSLIVDPGGDGWYVLARFIDALLHIRADGTRAWEVGGDHGTLTPTFSGPELRHAHASHAWREDDGDHVLVFDNRTHDPAPVVSRVIELRVDPENGTYDQVWELYDPQRRSTDFLGDARRLPSGNTLVDWIGRRELTEFTPAGAAVWTLETEIPLGRVVYAGALRP